MARKKVNKQEGITLDSFDAFGRKESPLNPDRIRGPYKGSRATRDKSLVEGIVESVHKTTPPKKVMDIHTPKKMELRKTETKPDIKKIKKKEMKKMSKEKKKEKWYPGKKLGIKYFSPESKAKRREKKQAKMDKRIEEGKTVRKHDVSKEVKNIHPISKHHTYTKNVVPTKAKTDKKIQDKLDIKEGDYPIMKKKSPSAKSFRSAFAKNRKAGKKTFTWQGRSYSTRQSGEGKSFDTTTGKWSKAEKKQMGGPVDDSPFKQGIKYYKSGGKVTVSNNKAGVGDVAHVHSNSGSNYKAGE